ncbi:MAG: AmmeMemoRadiSam system radical SAM enzyme [Desulfobacterales bacterium]|nr:AmmeMemoRadiSam system radical SAM enzyme [Desulfobacterales bacterium]MDJ0855622.1 AmmeMemoRadiSam system radical SAM enzyme [Desulfobacterales bacterium]MDJ0886790.1 AmmeMemoRadiSam system radical SAM enzyme [Desulfobacterales bacterium]
MEALLYEPLDDRKVRCRLCAHRCKVSDGRAGICGVRVNRRGRLETLVYGKLVARNVDPIEKKPLFHYLPGSRSYSIATVGCNFKCRFCQNADIAQLPAERPGLIVGEEAAPEDVVAEAVATDCASIAYTYTEPTVFFEFALAVAQQAKAAGLGNVFVTNGYMSAEALDMVAPYLDAANVDLKAYSDEFYREMCGARLAPVKATLKGMRARGVLVEVTTLVIPGLNDAPSELKALATFLVDELGPETPWHLSRFHPTYRLTDRAHTPVETLKAAHQIGLEAGLKYVYIGNVPGSGSENTYCPGCGNIIINRFHYHARARLIDGNHCAYCHTPIDGIF